MQRKAKRVYCDTAAATPMTPAVFQAMKPWMKDYFGNPSSLHQEGVAARKAIEESRSAVADFLNVRSDEVIFTGNGSEANTLAIIGVAETFLPGTMITSTLEHSSVRNCALELLGRGWKVEMVKPNKAGVISSEDVAKVLKNSDSNVLISVTLGSNEIGTVQPIREIAKVIRQARKQGLKRRIVFHTDACQAARFFHLDPAKLGVDALTINGAKIYGPKGVGVLWTKRGLILRPQIFGGGQEGGRRSGTEAVPEIVGLAVACRLVKNNYKKENELHQIQKYFIDQVDKKIAEVLLNGTGERLPHIVNLQISDVDAEQLVIELDSAGVAVSSGSACSSHKRDSSYVIMSLGRSTLEARSAVRFSFACGTRKRDVDFIVQKLMEIVERLRKLPKLDSNIQ